MGSGKNRGVAMQLAFRKYGVKPNVFLRIELGFTMSVGVYVYIPYFTGVWDANSILFNAVQPNLRLDVDCTENYHGKSRESWSKIW